MDHKSIKQEAKTIVSNNFWEFIKSNPDKHWDWSDISKNPNITWDIIKSNPDKPWDWEYISYNKFPKEHKNVLDQLYKEKHKKLLNKVNTEFTNAILHPDNFHLSIDLGIIKNLPIKAKYVCEN